jgi:hypothetical protein
LVRRRRRHDVTGRLPLPADEYRALRYDIAFGMKCLKDAQLDPGARTRRLAPSCTPDAFGRRELISSEQVKASNSPKVRSSENMRLLIINGEILAPSAEK